MQMEFVNINDMLKNAKTQKESNDKLFEFIKMKAASAIPHCVSEESEKAAAIAAKLKRGEVLTRNETQYLKENAPEIHRNASQLPRDRQDFNDEIRRCNTKQDVERAKTAKVSHLAGSTIGNPSTAEDVSSNDFVEMRIASINNTYDKFTKTDEFSKLPQGEKSIQALTISTLLAKQSPNILSGAKAGLVATKIKEGQSTTTDELDFFKGHVEIVRKRNALLLRKGRYKEYQKTAYNDSIK